MKVINNYLNKVKAYPNWRFILELTVLSFIFKILFIIIFSPLNLFNGVDLNLEKSVVESGFLMIIVFNIINASSETLILQWLIIRLTSLFTGKTWWKILISATVFSGMHLLPFKIITMFPLGIILAWSFTLKRKNSFGEAFFVTTAIHLLHNLLALSYVRLIVR